MTDLGGKPTTVCDILVDLGFGASASKPSASTRRGPEPLRSLLRRGLESRPEAMKAIARPYFPPRPPDAPPDPDLSQPGMLEALATEAGLTPESRFETSWAYEFHDDGTLARALLAPAGLALVVGPEREDEVTAAILTGLAPYRSTDGSYRLDNEYRYLIARA